MANDKYNSMRPYQHPIEVYGQLTTPVQDVTNAPESEDKATAVALNDFFVGVSTAENTTNLPEQDMHIAKYCHMVSRCNYLQANHQVKTKNNKSSKFHKTG